MIARAPVLVGLVALGIAIAGLVVGCGHTTPPPAPPSLPETPAQKTATDLTQREIAAAVAAADATASGNQAEAARQRAIADELHRLRLDAEARAKAERTELAELTTKAEADAQRRSEDHQRAEDRRRAMAFAGLGIALALAAGGLLLWLGTPAKLALGIPGAVIVACLSGSAWFAAGDVLLWVLGSLAVLAVLASAALATWVAIHLARETQHYAASAADPGTAEREALDTASLARQPAIVRWLISHVFTRHSVS